MDLRKYFHCVQPYFWEWEEDGSVIAIPHDKTISYRKYIKDVLEKLQPIGFPPFGTLLLALVATNPNGDESLNTITAIIEGLEKGANKEVMSDAISFLKMIASVPENYKSGNKRILLLQAIFYNCHNTVRPKNAISIFKELESHDNASIQNLIQHSEYKQSNFLRDFKPLALLKNQLPTIDSLMQRIMMLPDLTDVTIEIEESNTETKKTEDFVEELIEHDKTFYVGSLVKRIWSGLNIPVHSSLPSSQPLGGVSDLTNKGDFDKLLISEFANDDIVLLSRLANNEALYLHREIPPTNQHQQRIILIDITLKTWGTPKTVSFATAIALAKHPKTDMKCDVYLVGDDYKLIEINTIHGIIEGLQFVDAHIQAGKGIRKFLSELPQNKQQEIILITEPSTLKQIEMLKVVTEFHQLINYWIYTNQEGEIHVYKKHQSSKKLLQQLKLPIQELWNSKRIKTIEGKRNLTDSFPILFRNNSNNKKTFKTIDDETFQITTNNSLLRLYDKRVEGYVKGWELITTKLPRYDSGALMGKLINGDYYLILLDKHRQQINLFNIIKRTNNPIDFNYFDMSPSSRLIFHEEHFIYFNYQLAYYINPIDGKITRKSDKYAYLIKVSHEETIKEPKLTVFTQNILKNVQRVFLNDEHNLIINKHVLRIKNGQYIMLEPTNQLSKKIEAIKISDYLYQFPNGSTVEINLNGMLILRTVNDVIPPIYVPTVIDLSLGVSTEDAFAGNTYFQKEPLFDIVLKNPGEKKLEVVRSIMELTNIGLANSKQLVDEAPSIIERFATKRRVTHVTTVMVSQGAQLDIKRSNESEIENGDQQIMNTNSFFKKYIEEFTSRIAAHGS